MKIAHALVSGHAGKLEKEQDLEPRVFPPPDHIDSDPGPGSVQHIDSLGLITVYFFVKINIFFVA